MTEDQARQWIASRYPAAMERLAIFAQCVIDESTRQNLVSPSTLAQMWTRHILDSVQLLQFAPPTARTWCDIGTGAGFPGIVVALIFEGRVTLVEPRIRRATFLREAAETVGITTTVDVIQAKAENVTAAAYDVISARAVSSIDDILRMSAHLRGDGTRIILPRGRSGIVEVESARQRWHGLFHVEQSITDPESSIVVADQVSR